MNNGKVRIYDLSKELDLDNREILTICDQLQIAYKSHSSTISEEEAENIRSAAHNQPPHPSTPSKPAPIRKATAPTVESRNQTPLNSPTKKQQILEIRRPVGRGESAEKPELLGPPTTQTLSPLTEPIAPMAKSIETPVPPRPLQVPMNASDSGVPVLEGDSSPSTTEEVRPTVQSQPEPIQPHGDADSDRAENAVGLAKPSAPALDSAAPTLQSPAIASPAEGQAELGSEPAKSEAVKSEMGNPEVIKPEAVKPEAMKPEAVKPGAARPEGAKPEGRTEPRSEGGRPEGGRSEGRKAPGSPPAKPVSPAPRPVLNKPVPKSEKPERPAITPRSGDGAKKIIGKPAGAGKPADGAPNRPQIVELKRPKPTGPAGANAEGAPNRPGQSILKVNRPGRPDAAGADPTEAPKPVELLAKPTPPKARRKNWQEEEEETVESPEKAAKLAAKGKRRTQPRIDEDEDEDLDAIFEEDDEAAVSAAQMTLSLARPPKPKNLAASPKPIASVVTSAAKRGRTFNRRDRRDQNTNKQERPEIITLTGGVTVQELAQMMVVSDTEIIRNLFMKGIAATVTQTLDIGTATQVAEEMGIVVDQAEKRSEAIKTTEMISAEDLENLQRRPPVVTIMGHVDHGKTTLLDSIRKTKVAAGEAGGITQHIGAYHVDVEHNNKVQQVVFLDTPGHEAFTAMRARGARVTDIAVLVVAADDGVRPQTIEAISHAKAAGVPMVIAINKVDKEQAQPDRVKQELTEYQLVPEEWGGSTIMVPVSAMTGQNLDTLLEMLLLVAEVEDLTANPDRPAKGTVIEAHLDKAKGPVATLLVQNGTLAVGDILVAGSALGKVRAMMDDRGQRVKQASPSFAVEVLGLSDVPAAGDEFEVYRDEKEARSIATARADVQRQSRLMAAMSSRRVSLNTLSSKAQEGELKELNIVMKADVQGSVEAILGALKQLPQGEVQVRVLFAAPGEISETDVDLAAASEAVLIGFNTTLATGARQAADRASVDVREYNIIYTLLDDIQAAMEGMLEPELVEEPLGQVEVRAVFPVGKGAVAGCYIQSGKAIRNCKIRVKRGNTKLYEGNLDSLKRMREDAKEVNAGYECGIGIDSFNAWEIGDIIETFRMVTKRRTLASTR
jgi:translation initiation factor IF-2